VLTTTACESSSKVSKTITCAMKLSSGSHSSRAFRDHPIFIFLPQSQYTLIWDFFGILRQLQI
jgi:hypothetical protein